MTFVFTILCTVCAQSQADAFRGAAAKVDTIAEQQLKLAKLLA